MVFNGKEVKLEKVVKSRKGYTVYLTGEGITVKLALSEKDVEGLESILFLKKVQTDRKEH